MQATAEKDYFTDFSVLKDPYEYFESMRDRGGVYRSTVRPDVIMVTGFEESVEVLRNAEDFSSAIAPQGPALPLPFEPGSGDLREQIEAHRHEFVGGDLLVAYDGQQHKYSRSILNRLFTPSRLKANEEFIQAYSERLVKEMVAKGGCELINEVATPFVTLVIADLLGVPEDDRELFREVIDNAPPPGDMATEGMVMDENSPLVIMGAHFYNYVTDRRENPREDILTELSTATYPDGSLPDVLEIVRLAIFLFGAGQDTSAKLLGNSLRRLAEDHELQAQLRDNPSRIPDFIEEVLRIEGSTKMTARIALRDTRIGEMEIPAGTKVMVAIAAANRDAKRWEAPAEFNMDRPKLREHLAFSRGPHVCAGAPLARVEVRIILEHLLGNTSLIDFDEARHGDKQHREVDYEASFIIRGLSELHLKLSA
ncbi:cytochrome P450 [Haliea sp. E17]|uniref:cytochrome P450 n=1 Tax=Haliea sp. E17 TaxID=3401576 RepID=UPI003AAB7503